MSDDIYEALSNLLNVKFKAQYNNSPIVFEKFFKITDILSGNEDYVLVIEPKTVIKFKDKEEFINEFKKLLEFEIEDLQRQFLNLQRIEREDRLIDENAIFLEHETIGYNTDKLSSLLKRLKKL